ncbi:MAG: hypothetical protein Q7J07_00955 [Pelolinea sp.]|nr:hypothetical protein [Pelolinea sp.]
MKKIFILPLFFLIVLACSISSPSNSFDERTATHVALALTATALDQEINQEPTQKPIDEEKSEPTKSATNTPTPLDDPKKDLGAPTWSDDLSTGKYWSLESGDIVIDTTTLSVNNGKLTASAAVTGKGTNWWLTYLTFQDAYLEAAFDVGKCTSDDQYGLVFRAPDYESGVAYYFHVTCDGHYDVRRWSNSGATMLLGMSSSERINTGAEQTNTLGVWVKGPIIRLYVNDFLIEELNDSALANTGHFGLFINARQTPGFSVSMDEISYWVLD